MRHKTLIPVKEEVVAVQVAPCTLVGDGPLAGLREDEHIVEFRVVERWVIHSLDHTDVTRVQARIAATKQQVKRPSDAHVCEQEPPYLAPVRSDLRLELLTAQEIPCA